MVLSFIFDFNGLYGQDSHAYYKYAKELFLFFNTGSEPNYFYWPKIYPSIGALLGYTGIPILFLLRLVSFFSLIGALYFANKLIYQIYNKDGKEWLFLGGVFATYFIRGSVLVMSDMLGAFFTIAFFYHFVVFHKTGKSLNLLLMICFVGLTFFVRYASLPLFIIPMVIVVYGLFKKLNLLNVILIGAGFLVSLYSFLLYQEGFIDLISEFFLRWKFEYIYSRSFYNKDGFIEHLVPNVFYIFGNFFHLGYLSIGIFVVPFIRRNNYLNTVILGSILFYLIFLSGFSTQNYRFLLISHLLVLVYLFPAYHRLKEWLKTKNRFNLFFISTIIFNSLFFDYSFRKTYLVHLNEKVIAKELIKIIKDETIYSFYVDQSFPSYGIKNEIKNFYMDDYKEFEYGSLVIFNEDKFQGQWEGTLVMKNWNRLMSDYELEEVKDFGNNWKIYRVKGWRT